MVKLEGLDGAQVKIQLGDSSDDEQEANSVIDKGPSQLFEAIEQGSRVKVKQILELRPQWVSE